MKLYEYIDYHKYLNDYYHLKKEQNPSFSFGTLARKARISSRGHLQLIFSGQRNIGARLLPKLCKGLDLNKKESSYFELIVKYKHAASNLEKDQIFAQIRPYQSRHNFKTLATNQYDYYAKWYYSLVREMVLLTDKPYSILEMASFISERTIQKISVSEARNALEALLEMGLIHHDDEVWRQQDQHISGQDDTVAHGIRDYYRTMFDISKDALEIDLQLREMSGVTLSIKSSDIQTLKEQIKDFRRQINQQFSANTDADEVYQVNIQLFPLTKSPKTLLNRSYQ